MRILAACAYTLTFLGSACVSTPNVGQLGEGSASAPKIIAVDSGRPPRSVSVQLDQPAYVAILLVAPGHSATLLYPTDSVTDNRLAAGPSNLSFRIPEVLVRSDSAVLVQRARQRQAQDSSLRRNSRVRAAGSAGLQPLPPETPTYLLLVTSPQSLNYGRIVAKTAGVSIPLVETEALNAVGKAIKSTLAVEPRAWAGTYLLVELSKLR